MNPQYNPKDVEQKWYDFWTEKNYFHAEPNKDKKPYTIVIPPPNVTGILHMGHALNNTIQDILIRYKRMQNFSSLWMPGTDHAGIATQNVVERQLAKENLKRDDIGREKFIERVWRWKEEYGNTIIKQLKRLGCSCDWERERFTMDEGLSDAVSETFIRLYNKGLIYKGKYIINWCPRCHTALSDEESEHRDLEGKLYYLKYKVKDSDEYIVVATTRPETMFGDVAVAINPKDQRYLHLIGKKIILPILERELELIKDDFVDREFGTGVVKVTPAHDPNDFDMGSRHNLEPIVAMNPSAMMNKNAGKYEGMDRFECREVLIEELQKRKQLEKIETHHHSIGHCYRCHTVIEPYLSDQWFVKMKPLAQPAIEAVKEGKIKFYPFRWTKVYLNWMENIRDWCISRQIWWGHRIPVYYCNKCYNPQATSHRLQVKSLGNHKNKGIFVSKTKPEKCPDCGGTDIYQDPDVLDTWFSSWLWPFSTLGWPFTSFKSPVGSDQLKDKNPAPETCNRQQNEFNYFYPTDILVTAQEIIFFWVARMIMSGMEFIGEIPFKDIYIHGTVRDDKGTKMSKSLGNVIDPLDIIQEFGADALRFSLISITASGQDVFLSRDRFQSGRNFANKIWNASRFVLSKSEITSSSSISRNDKKLSLQAKRSNLKEEELSLADKWILNRLNRIIEKVTESIEKYRFNDAVNVIYDFFWHQFCDWYLEMIKTENSALSRVIVLSVLETSLRLLHPVMPFITEEIWQKIKDFSYISLLKKGDRENLESIMIASWPKADKKWINETIEKDISLVIDIIVAIRNIRAEMNIAPSLKLKVIISAQGQKQLDILTKAEVYLKFLARLDRVDFGVKRAKPKGSATAVVKEVEIFIPLKGLIDVDKEKQRISTKITTLERELSGLTARLSNKQFLDKAPEKVVQGQTERKKEVEKILVKLKENLASL